jgi:ABC-type bacteriocin/lantibiotic exporter with double-glycine peptidase domain
LHAIKRGHPLILLPVDHIPQRTGGDCLAACVAMVLAYLEAPIDYERILKLMGIDPDLGAPFFRIQVLDQEGITSVFGQGALADLFTFLANGWPCIVPLMTGDLPHWLQVDTGHAIVVIGMGEDSIYLNDPAFTSAPIQVPLGDFELAWIERDCQYVVLAPRHRIPL